MIYLNIAVISCVLLLIFNAKAFTKDPSILRGKVSHVVDGDSLYIKNIDKQREKLKTFGCNTIFAENLLGLIVSTFNLKK